MCVAVAWMGIGAGGEVVLTHTSSHPTTTETCAVRGRHVTRTNLMTRATYRDTVRYRS
jgi:hypothetical protein